MTKRPKKLVAQKKKLFVLDTNVLMHDPSSLFRFEEHDVYLPMMVLEELDNNKKGLSEVARNARQATRFLDELVSRPGVVMEEGIPLKRHNANTARGRLYLQTENIQPMAMERLPVGKADNQILGMVLSLITKRKNRDVVLVSKDINMRIKAKILGLAAEDYASDKVLEDTDLLYAGIRKLPSDFWETHGKDLESGSKEGRAYYRVRGPLTKEFLHNEFVYLEDEHNPSENPFYAIVRETGDQNVLLEVPTDYMNKKNAVWGIVARNREQNFAINLLMDPNIHFVTLLGQVGTGKTLLALATGLTQVLDQKRYSEIIMTRITVSVGEDIGFLPGSEEEKMQPWMGALEDNLEVLALDSKPSFRKDGDATPRDKKWGQKATHDFVGSKIKVKSLNFMRGRTFLNKWLIIDEAQNLTPKQMKTLVTRAGPGTKVVCLGNIAQIDTPYLTEGSSGLTYVVDRLKGWPHSGHVTLARGERSLLADYAGEVL